MVEPTRPGGADKAPPQTAHGGEGGVPLCGQCHGPIEPQHHFCPTCGVSLTGLVASVAHRDPFIGAVVAGRYRLLAKLGVGGMGTVYKVEHVRMGKIMAMKLLHGDLSRDETMVRRFTREARAISRLKGRHTVQIFDFGYADGLFFLVMEYLQGRDLGELLLERRRLSPRRTVALLGQIAEGLADAHRAGVVHRDLKPENIFVCARTDRDDEIVKVLDFGLAKLQKRDESMIRTQRGLILGTPHYMSPEQIDGHDVGPETDLYALAALLFKTLTGRPPYPGDNALRVLNAHLDAPVPQISAIDPALAALDGFFARGLAKQAGERFGSAAELASAFKAAVAGEAEPAPVVEPGGSARNDSGGEYLLPRLAAHALDNLATYADFDRYELWLKIRRIGTALLALGVVGGLAWLVVWGLVLGNLHDRTVESEPNDSLKEANDLVPGQGVLAVIGEPPDNVRADRDIFRVTEVAAGRMVSVRVTGIPELDLVVDMVSREGHLLFTQNAASEGYAEVVPNFPMPDDELYVVVREVWREGMKASSRPDLFYAVSLDSRQPLAGEELEPNDTARDATPLHDRTAQGIVCSAQDRDLYRLEWQSGVRSFSAFVTGVPRVDLRLALLDARGETLKSVDDRGLAQGEHLVMAFDSERVQQPLYLVVTSVRGSTTDHHYRLEYTSEALR